MSHRLWLLISVALALLFVLTPVLPVAADSLAAPLSQDSTPLPDGPVVVRIYYDDPAQITLLKDYDLFEFNNKKEQYVLAAMDLDQMLELRAGGWRVEIDPVETAAFNREQKALPGQEAGIPGYPCYRTVEETFLTAQALAAAHPNLATWVDAGDSWEKATAGGLPGYDMGVLVLTNSAVPGPKPKLFITASIHAREYTPAELATRFAELLVNGYGVDPDATWILDHHEVHLMLHTNPDGRKQAETGLSWRKNTNQAYCGATSPSRGADLNRNFQFQWGCCGGSSGSVCSDTYRGPSAASEPEVQAVQNYMRAIFPDQRADPLTSPAPADATGVYLDIHSYSQLVLWPWGFTSTVAPNGPALQTLGRKFAFFNNYTPEQAIGLYATDGTTDDFGYGDLGVASYTFELGTAFFQACSTFESTILPDNMKALVYAAKVVRTPYQTPAGPDALTVTAAPAAITLGDPVVLTAIINDTRFNNSNGAEPSQAIAAAEYYIDTPPWQPGAVAYPMAAADGNFNSTIEAVTANLNTSALGAGRHMLFVRGKDAANNWGAFSAVFLNVEVLSVTPQSVAICTPVNAVFTVNVGYNGSVSMSASGHPAGTTAAFSPNPVPGPGSSTLTIGNTAAAAPGAYQIDITGTYNSGSQTNQVQLNVASQPGGVTTLLAPANNATGVGTTPTFTWSAASQAATYRFDLATNASFSAMVHSASGLTGTSYTLPLTLNTSVRYYWRVYADNACGTAGPSATFNFTTVAAPGDCTTGATPNILYTYGFESGASGWTTPAGTGTNTWSISTANPHTGAAAYRAAGTGSVTDQRLVSPAIVLPTGENPVVLKFWHTPNLEANGATACYDGGVLEVSTDGGANWTYVPNSSLLVGPYRSGVVSGSFSNPLAGRNAWCGASSYMQTIADVSAYAGQTAQFRMRLGTDSSTATTGWDVDDVVMQSCEASCAYDVNGSGAVDIVDVQLVAGAFGANVPAYDFNNNNIVDVSDIQTVADRWLIGC
ncbi:MAG: M14 family zinc carboxypeptidase [Anaerolineae bacterium]